MRIERIKNHFNEEAAAYDAVIGRLIPHYGEMIEALVDAIPFPKDRIFQAIDLGCGTGTVSKAVKECFPGAELTCIDISENMLETAAHKLGGHIRVPGSSVHTIRADFHDFEFPRQYDLVVSSLALHHLESDGDKLTFYRKIHSALTPGGVFINADVVLGADEGLQSVYMRRWREFLERSVSPEEIDGKWLPSYYAEDRPASLTTHLDMLSACGFTAVDVVCKYYNYAVYTAKKRL